MNWKDSLKRDPKEIVGYCLEDGTTVKREALESFLAYCRVAGATSPIKSYVPLTRAYVKANKIRLKDSFRTTGPEGN